MIKGISVLCQIVPPANPFIDPTSLASYGRGHLKEAEVQFISDRSSWCDLVIVIPQTLTCGVANVLTIMKLPGNRHQQQ